MTSLHTDPRKRSRRSLTAMAGALFLALTALSGCAELPRGPLAAPSQPMFLEGPEPRALGPIRPVSESDVHIVKKEVPSGTTAVEKSSFDMDSNVRAGNEVRNIEMRFTQHQGRVLRVQSLGVTGQGLLRFRIDYLHDGTISLAGEKRSSKTSPALGNTYVVELGRSGPQVSTKEGYIPRPDEIDVVLEDTRHLLSLVAGGGPSSPPLTSERVSRSVRKALVREGMEVGDVKASWKGVREVAGTPCAIFDLSVDAVKRQSEPDQSLVMEMRLSGEYAVRLTDGWEAELFLTGSLLSTGHIQKNGVVIPISTAGLARLHIAATYREPQSSSPDSVAGR